MTTLAQSFHALKMSVSKQLDSMNTPVKELHEVVVSLYPYAAIPKSLMARLEGAANCQDYFTIITIHGMWNYINHHLLECIVEKLIPRDNDMRKAIALHGSNVTEFAAKTHIDDYIDVCSRKLSETLVVEHAIPHPTMFIPFQLQLEPSIQRKCLHSVLTLQNHLMKHFSLPHPTLMLGSVGRGSTVIVFQFPQVEMERVCSVANTSSGFFRDLNVESVTIGNQFQYSQNTSVPTSQEVSKSCHPPISIKLLFYVLARQEVMSYRIVSTMVNFLVKRVCFHINFDPRAYVLVSNLLSVIYVSGVFLQSWR